MDQFRSHRAELAEFRLRVLACRPGHHADREKLLTDIDPCTALDDSRYHDLQPLSAEACRRLPDYKLFCEPDAHSRVRSTPAGPGSSRELSLAITRNGPPASAV